MAMLQELHVLDAWFVTRVRLDEWIVTHLRGSAPFNAGDKLPIPRMLREHILKGQRTKMPTALTFEPNSVLTESSMPADYGFIGAPLVVRDELYGVLCGLDTRSTVAGTCDDSPSLSAAARILSTILRKELDAEELLRRAERAEAEALIDELTGLFNRRGWDRLVEREETRAARYGHSATVIIMDVDGLKQSNDLHGHVAGDTLLRGVAEAIRCVVRDHDVAARLGGDEFAILAVESDDDMLDGLRSRLDAAFVARGISVSIGVARREFDGGIPAAIVRADAAMYERKFARSAAAQN